MEPTPADAASAAAVELRCRICLETDVSEMISLFCVASTQKKLLAHMTLAVAGVPISMCDKMPQVVCDKCLGNLDVAYGCWRRCRESWGDYVRDPALKDKEEDFRCRICLRSNVEELISVYCICDSQLLKINEMVKQYSGVEVKDDDGHPQYICEACLGELNIGFDFRKLCRQSNVKLRLELQAKEAAAAPARVESDNESLPEAERAPEPSRVGFKKIAKRRQSVSKMMAKPELSAGVKVKRLDIPEVVPGSFKKKVFSSPSEFKELTNQILSKPKESPPKAPVEAKPSTSKKTFSSPSEFKKLANQIMEKTTKKPQESSSLVAFEIRVLTDSEHYTHSEISSFKCSRCRTRNPLNTIGVTCVKCGSAFDNYLIVMPHKGKSSMTAYCCIECNYFAITLTTIVSHLAKHQQQPVVPPSKPKPIVMRKLVVPIVPIVMKEETVEAPQIEDDSLPDPLETVFVPGTMSNGAKRANEDPEPEPEVQSKKPKKKPSSETMDVLLEMNQSEPETISDAETISSGDSVPRRPPSSTRSIASKSIDADALFDTLLEVTHYKVLYLRGALCCGCSKLFLKQDVLNRHQDKCPKLGDVSLQQQILSAKRVFYYCKICPQLLLKQDFESHRVEKHSTTVVRSTSKSNLLVKKQVPSGSKPPLKLTSADPTIFKPLKETAQYRLLLLQGHPCCRCHLVYSSEEQLLRHRAEEHPPATVPARYRCGQCQENCRSEAKLARHRLDAARKLYYACKLCQRSLLESGEDFEEHRMQLHPKLEVMRMPTEPTLLVEV